MPERIKVESNDNDGKKVTMYPINHDLARAKNRTERFSLSPAFTSSRFMSIWEPIVLPAHKATQDTTRQYDIYAGSTPIRPTPQ